MIKAIALSRVIMLIFTLLFSPCLLALLPDTKQKRRQHKAEHEYIRRELTRQGERQNHIEQEQEVIRKVQERQQEQIDKLQFQIEQLTADIENDRIRAGRLYALLDIAEANQAAAVPGSKADEAAQRKILTLENQIAAAERRIRAAQYKKQTAERQLAA